METIFDFNPSDDELIDILGYNQQTREIQLPLWGGVVSVNKYNSSVSNEGRIFNIALLLESRNDERAKEYWAQIPEIEQQYRLGLDNDQISV